MTAPTSTGPRLTLVRVNGAPKGDLTYRHGRWWWTRPSGATEVFPRRFSRKDIAEHIARLCLVGRAAVTFQRETKP